MAMGGWANKIVGKTPGAVPAAPKGAMGNMMNIMKKTSGPNIASNGNVITKGAMKQKRKWF